MYYPTNKVSHTTDKILPIVKEWQRRPLGSIYAVVFMDAIHYHVRSEGQIIKKAIYIAIVIWMVVKTYLDVGWRERDREIRGYFFQQFTESGYKGYLHRLHGQFDRIFLGNQRRVSQDGYQNCVTHQLRNSGKYVFYKDI